MSEVEFSEPVKKADKWAWVGSMLVTMALFFIGAFLTGDVMFSAIVGAGAGIGTQFLIPYQASMMVPADERVSLQEHPNAGNYHHGGAGTGLIVSSLVALAVMIVTMDSTVGLWVGGIVLAVSYFVFSSILPRR